MSRTAPGKRTSGGEKALSLVMLGRRGYGEMLAAQEALVERRRSGEIPDLLLILEHPPTYTRGRRSEPSDLHLDPDWYREHGIEVFDCSGLITTALYRAHGPDLRFTHGAAQLQACCPADVPGALRLRFYPGHVALRLRPVLQTPAELADSRPILIEAAGGGSATTAPTPGGYVRRGPERRRDFVAEGSLSAYLATL